MLFYIVSSAINPSILGAQWYASLLLVCRGLILPEPQVVP